jgi:hypothetical protein
MPGSRAIFRAAMYGDRRPLPERRGDEAKRAFDAMMPMKKIDIATIEAARRAGVAVVGRTF